MSERVTRKLWLNAWTDKAIMVAPEPYHRARSNRWLPRLLIEEVERETVRNPLFGEKPGAVEILGVMLTFTAPDWALERVGLRVDAELPA